MSTLSKPYVFTAGTPAVAAQENSNLDTLYGWVNTDAIWSDASRAFSAVPSGPATDPTAPNHLTRKSYVDSKVSTSLAAITGLGLVSNGSGNNAILIQGGRVSVTTNSIGSFTFVFPTPFTHTGFAVTCNVADIGSGNHTVQTSATINAGGFTGRVYDTGTGVGLASTTLNISYIALGT